MSPYVALVIMLLLVAAALAMTFLLSVHHGEYPTSMPPVESSVSVDGGGIVTVRKVGPVTSVLIRGVSDHWEGEGGVPLPLLPVEATRIHEPELYSEYMSPGTSASRKYEIIEEVYAKGFTLPFIKGLNEQYKRELLEGGPNARAALERMPVNLTGTGGLQINEGLRREPLPDMGADPEPESEPQPEEP